MTLRNVQREYFQEFARSFSDFSLRISGESLLDQGAAKNLKDLEWQRPGNGGLDLLKLYLLTEPRAYVLQYEGTYWRLGLSQ